MISANPGESNERRLRTRVRQKLSVRESQQKYKDLYGNPNERPEKIILQNNSQLKSLTLFTIVGRFLPVWFFFRFDAN